MSIRTKMISSLLALSAISAFAAPPAPVHDFDVFVDPPTGFVFVKLPERWVFAGKVDATRLSALPPTVHTTVLDEPADERTAQTETDSKAIRAAR